MTKDNLIYAIAEHMMLETRGFTKKNDFPLEWDTTHESSQISLVIDDINEILTFLEKNYGYTFDYARKRSSTGTVHTTTTTYAPPPVIPSFDEPNGVDVDVSVNIRTRHNPSLSEIKEFLHKADLIGANLEQRVTGHLLLSTLLPDTVAYQIECGDCGEQDLIIETHSCKVLYDN